MAVFHGREIQEVLAMFTKADWQAKVAEVEVDLGRTLRSAHPYAEKDAGALKRYLEWLKRKESRSREAVRATV